MKKDKAPERQKPSVTPKKKTQDLGDMIGIEYARLFWVGLIKKTKAKLKKRGKK